MQQNQKTADCFEKNRPSLTVYALIAKTSFLHVATSNLVGREWHPPTYLFSGSFPIAHRSSLIAKRNPRWDMEFIGSAPCLALVRKLVQ